MNILVKAVLTTACLLFANQVVAADQEVVFSCKKIQLPVEFNEETGEVTKWEKWSGTISVVESKAAPYGYTGIISQDGEQQRIDDTKLEILNRAGIEETELLEAAKAFIPNFKEENAVAAYIADIGVKANEDDAAGFMIFEFRDSKDKPMGKLVKIGWGVGVCGI